MAKTKAPPGPADVWRYAHRKSRRRAIRVTVMAPVAVVAVVPQDFRHLSALAGLGRIVVQLVSAAQEWFGDVRAVRRGDPLVICGKVPPEKPPDFYRDYAAILADNRLAFTFGYELTIEVRWAARIARDGSLTEAPDYLAGSRTVRSARHVTRKAPAGEKVVLICNSAGTALALESDIPDPALADVLRNALPGECAADEEMTPPA